MYVHFLVANFYSITYKHVYVYFWVVNSYSITYNYVYVYFQDVNFLFDYVYVYVYFQVVNFLFDYVWTCVCLLSGCQLPTRLHMNMCMFIFRLSIAYSITYEYVYVYFQVVNFLLDYVDTKSTYEALLLAIKLGHDEVAEMILEHPKYEEINNEFRKHSDEPFFSEKFCDHSQFTDEITPLILAAQNNRYEIVMALLMKGQTIEKPHKYNCICIQCHEKAKKDELKFAKSRLNAYKGMASEAYLSLSSEDPILTSFELRHELHQVATAEKYYTVSPCCFSLSLSWISHGYVIIYSVKFWMKLRIHSQTSTVQPLNFGNGYVIPSNTSDLL